MISRSRHVMHFFTKLRLLKILSLILSLAGLLALPATLHAEDNCSALAASAPQATTVTSAEMRPAGAFTAPKGKRTTELPAFCRVAGRLQPTSDSDIGFELWMPPADSWNGKLLVVGNGGYVGEIRYDELEPAIRRGYAVASSDSGHTDTAAYRNETLEWGVGHPDKIADWAYRSVHAVATAARALTSQFERKDAVHSYYYGCSTGGGQGLMAAQRYPDDFDGIIAGAPGFNRTGLNIGFLWTGAQNLRDRDGYIPSEKLSMINRAAISACDASDGLADGLIGDPRQCRFDPKVLQCKDNVDGQACLTTPQIETLGRLYAGAKRRSTDRQIYPGWPIGSESGYEGGWAYAMQGPQPFRLEFFKNWVFKDPKWDWRTFDWDKDVDFVRSAIGGTVDAVNPDLAAFKKRGGKLILFHGWADPIGNAVDTIQYYEEVGQKLEDSPASVRLFLAPGMGHCRGGIGPNAFDAIGALEKWVERDQPPEQIVALKSATTDRMGGLMAGEPDKTQGRTRPLCSYPLVASYKGTGSTDDADNFRCSIRN